jgi:phospholipase D3/4
MRLCVVALLVAIASAAGPQIEVLETAPNGSDLDLRELRNAIDVFPGLFTEAESTIEISQMYMLWYRSESRGAILFSFYDRLIEAARRGVKVRILLDSTTLEGNASPTYGRMRDSLNRFPGIEVRAVDFRPLSQYPECMLHTKYLIIDGRVSVIGSHNWSYSAFTDNRELSLLVRDAMTARQLRHVFETDWLVAKGGFPPVVSGDTVPESGDTIRDLSGDTIPNRGDSGHVPSSGHVRGTLTLVVSSPDRLRDSTLLSTVDALRRITGKARLNLDIEVNSLTTRVDFGDSKRFLLLDSLIRKAAWNTVRVRLLVDKWAYDFEPQLFRSLNNVDNIQVRIIDISDLGPNPGTGSAHAKLVIADAQSALLGSATFSQRQIMECRNVGLLVEDRQPVGQLQKVFERDWNSPYCFKP